jgi:hypothetical protein
VLAIRPHGSAHHAGISVGDWIHSIQRNDGTWRDLSSKENFEAIIEKKIPGDVIRIRLYALRCVSAQRSLGAAAPLLLPVMLPYRIRRSVSWACRWDDKIRDMHGRGAIREIDVTVGAVGKSLLEVIEMRKKVDEGHTDVTMNFGAWQATHESPDHYVVKEDSYVEINGSPFLVEVEDLPADPERCSTIRKLPTAEADATGSKWLIQPFVSVTEATFVGEEVTFLVTLRDSCGRRTDHVPGGLHVTARMRGSNSGIDVSMAHTDHGEHDGRFLASIVGTVQLFVCVGSTNIRDSPYLVAVEPGPACPEQCSALRKVPSPCVDGPATLLAAAGKAQMAGSSSVVPFVSVKEKTFLGEEVFFRISLRDKYGNATDKVLGGLNVTARMQGTDELLVISMAHVGQGEHHGRFLASVPGIVQLFVCIGSTNIRDSPYLVEVEYGPAFAPNCTATVKPTAPVGERVVFGIRIKDTNGIPTDNAGGALAALAELQPTDEASSENGPIINLPVSLIRISRGEYEGAYTALNPGTAVLSITVGKQQHISGSAFTTQITEEVKAIPVMREAVLPAVVPKPELIVHIEVQPPETTLRDTIKMHSLRVKGTLEYAKAELSKQAVPLAEWPAHQRTWILVLRLLLVLLFVFGLVLLVLSVTLKSGRLLIHFLQLFSGKAFACNNPAAISVKREGDCNPTALVSACITSHAWNAKRHA